MYFIFSLSISDFSNKAILRHYQSPLVLITGALVYYIEDITRKDHETFHKKALQRYVNTPQVIFCLSYDFSKELFIFFKVDIYFNEKGTVVMDVVMT